MSNPVTHGPQIANEFGPITYVTQETLAAENFTIPVANTKGYPTSGKILCAVAQPGANGILPVRELFSYTGVTNTEFTGCNLISGSGTIPALAKVYYAKSGLSNGAMTIPGQIITGTGADGRPHDLVLIAAYDPSEGHVRGDYDIVLTREAGSWGVLQIGLPVRFNKDTVLTDGVNVPMLTIAGGDVGTGNNGGEPNRLPTGTIVVHGTIVGGQGKSKTLILKAAEKSSISLRTSGNAERLKVDDTKSVTISGDLNVTGVIRNFVTNRYRPDAVTSGVGAQYYDASIKKPIWSDGTIWRDAMGTAI